MHLKVIHLKLFLFALTCVPVMFFGFIFFQTPTQYYQANLHKLPPQNQQVSTVPVVTQSGSVVSRQVVGEEENVAPVAVAVEENKASHVRTVNQKFALNYREDLTSYNPYEAGDWLFRFHYKNSLRLHQFQGLTYLKPFGNNPTVFQIFERTGELDFEASEFQCYSYTGTKAQFQNREVCHSKKIPFKEIVNLEIFGEPDFFHREHVTNLQARGLPQYITDFNARRLVSRAEALWIILALRYPQKDFSPWWKACFDDISAATPYAGEICFAKKEGLVLGIENKFFPENSINYWYLKILFEAFEISEFTYSEDLLEGELFESMGKTHKAYPYIAQAVFSGLIQNPQQHTYWSNQTLYFGELIRLTDNFLQWKDGKHFRTEQEDSAQSAWANNLFLNTPHLSFSLETQTDADPEIVGNHGVELKLAPNQKDTRFYYAHDSQIYVYLGVLEDVLPEEIRRAELAYDAERREGKLLLEKHAHETEIYKLEVKRKNYAPLRTLHADGASEEIVQLLAAIWILPNQVENPFQVNTLPQLKIYLAPADLENLFLWRTSEKRYPAFLELVYTDGSVQQQSVLIKTRGNATRGYIKSGFTIESFRDFEDSEDFKGDEFLHKADEIKLRNSINEESMLHEKLFYRTFGALGHPAPDFFDALVEINGIPLGHYQITEAVKKDFFKNHKIKTKHYYYSRYSDAIATNLTYFQDAQTTLSKYKIKGDGEKLLQFIRKLDRNEPSLMQEINLQNVFDYALLAYLFNARDSLTHNYYVYLDADTGQWNIFPWDGDKAFEEMPEYQWDDFLNFARRENGLYNNLIRYVFQNLPEQDLEKLHADFQDRWTATVSLVRWTQQYQKTMWIYFQYDNLLWNGKFLERKDFEFDTLQAIKDLQKILGNKEFL